MRRCYCRVAEIVDRAERVGGGTAVVLDKALGAARYERVGIGIARGRARDAGLTAFGNRQVVVEAAWAAAGDHLVQNVVVPATVGVDALRSERTEAHARPQEELEQKVTKDTKNSRRGSAMASRRHPTKAPPPPEIQTTLTFLRLASRSVLTSRLSSSWPSWPSVQTLQSS